VRGDMEGPCSTTSDCSSISQVKPLNMPFYLLKSLTKMASKVQAKPQKASNSLFHHGLIKLIVLEELNRRNKTWDFLLFWGEFGQEVQPKKGGTPSQELTSPKTSKRKRRALSPVETATRVSPSKSQKTKRKLEFGKNAKDQGKTTETNVLNLSYYDSDSDPVAVEMETPEESGTTSKKKVSKKPKIQKLKDRNC
jgi:hypothetical protein